MKLEYFREGGVDFVRRVVEPSDRLAWARVPERFKSRALAGTWIKTLAIEAIERFVKREGSILVLAGDTGCGKSFAAAVAISQLGGLWSHAPDLAHVAEEGEVRPELAMRAASLLVLDDVGIEHSPSGYAASRISDVLEDRDARSKPSLITTNLSPEEFRARYGPRIASRVNGDPLGWFTCTGPDLRVNKGLRVVP